MKIYNSNSSNALIQDLGPFKMKSANLSIKGKIKLEYETFVQPKTIGSQSIYGKYTNPHLEHGYMPLGAAIYTIYPTIPISLFILYKIYK